MSQDIGSGDYITKIPSLTDDANIQDALRLYHYGEEFEPTKSIAYHLGRIEGNALNKEVVDLNSGSISGTSIDNNLNNVTETGFYFQTSSTNAATGQNYPKINNIAYAGSLKVVASGLTAATSIVYQEYHMSGGSQNVVFWRNRFPNESSQYIWSEWKRLVDTTHTHDDRYYTRTQVFNPDNDNDANALGYTKTQADNKFLTLSTLPSGAPVGSISMFAGETLPAGWLSCKGQLVSRIEYADLFAVLGVKYGVGDGSTTFGLPNLQARVPVGQSDTDNDFESIGTTGGSKTHTLTTNEIPSHTHAGPNHNHSFSGSGSDSAGEFLRYSGSQFRLQPRSADGWIGFSNGSDTVRISVSGSTSYASGTTGASGGGAAHNIMQPYIVMNYIIKSVP